MDAFLGFGLGLRTQHYSYILEHRPKIDWFEAITEDYLVPGGKSLYYLNRIRELYPLVMHGVSLSIGSCDPLNMDYLKKIKRLAEKIQPAWISDHLCWTGIDGLNMHDLLPLPYTEEVAKHVVDRVKQVQDFLGRRILLENVSSYIEYRDSNATEWEFLTAIAQQADCLILLDINNIYVSSVNHHFDPLDYLNAIPIQRVRQFHLAGHKNCGDYNSYAIWQALAKEKIVPKVQKTKSHCVVWCKELQSYAVAVTEVEALVLNRLQQDFCFADVCAAVYDKGFMVEAQVASFVANLLATWLNNHLFSEVKLS